MRKLNWFEKAMLKAFDVEDENPVLINERMLMNIIRVCEIKIRGGVNGNGEVWLGCILTEVWPNPKRFTWRQVRYCRIVKPHERTRNRQLEMFR